MPGFTRTLSSRWHDEVPGARWFRADLHVHTLDDAPGQASWQSPGHLATPLDPSSPETRTAYSRALLKAAIAAGIEVIGLTPHSARANGTGDNSVTWDIIDLWSTGLDDDSVPFRDKIYAVFPGFEPSVSDGSGGLHLLFLFDPEIGRDRFLNAYTVITGGQNVWRDGGLKPSPNSAADAFAALRDLKNREGHSWDYLCLAPHAFSDKGLVKTLKGDLLTHFPNSSVAGLELKDNWLPQDAFEEHDYLLSGVSANHQSLFHASDAYCLETPGRTDEVPILGEKGKRGLGYRFTYVKLASPHIESLRQAFLSSDSRVRIAYSKNDTGLSFAQNPPLALALDRPWLRTLKVNGGASFFGGPGRTQTLQFSPDLTCIIGGRMTGKSTLLDGLRIFSGHALPDDESLAEDVKERALVFSAGNAAIQVDIVGRTATTLPVKERWPARFFTQRELARITKDEDAVRHILFHLSPNGAESLRERFDQLGSLDKRLNTLATTIASARASLGEREQGRKTAADAKAALVQFRDAGVEQLSGAQAAVGKATAFILALGSAKQATDRAKASVAALKAPEVSTAPNDVASEGTSALSAELQKSSASLEEAVAGLQAAEKLASAIKAATTARSERMRLAAQAALAANGRRVEDLNEFEALSRLAGGLEQASTTYNEAHSALIAAETEFASLEKERTSVVDFYRASMKSIVEVVNASIPTIRVAVEFASNRASCDEWIRSIRDGGVTRWWNDSKAVTDPAAISRALFDDSLPTIGMSATVASRFKELMTEDRRYQLRALRSEDRFPIEAMVEKDSPKSFRPLERLSGGKQVSVMLSLLLESLDSSPLVIDQPEDELDKAFLAGTLLPILRRLKGRRQIIFATHDANLVVNGDADQVIYLDASKDSATVRAHGAIDEAGVREAILHILDGGRDAFGLRQLKYGF